ncbi:MAG: translation elongation factor Ts [Patescibacteria group bacterium]|jgi:elongation factor Ts
MAITTENIKKLREQTGVGIMDAKTALKNNDGDFTKAIDYLKKQGQKVAEKKQDRKTKEGAIGYYIHANHKVAALVALACESDFVANTDDFRDLAHDLAMQVAATDPTYISPKDVPAEIIGKEKEIYSAQLKKDKKPDNIIDKIIKGKLDKFYSEVCLIKQPFIKEDKKTIEDIINEKILKLGENIQIKEIKKMSL